MEEPQSPCNLSGFCRAPKVPRFLPSFNWSGAIIVYCCDRRRERCKEGFSSTFLRQQLQLDTATSPLVAGFLSFFLPLLFFLPLKADHSVAFCPRVASDLERHCIVISIRRTCLFICLPVRLHACLPVGALPTVMPYSCPIHLLLNKRLLSSGHPLLHWLLFFYRED